MQLTILGSAAAEGVPALWCECEACRHALEHGGKDLRRRCSYLLDRDTMIDFGPDAFWQMTHFKIDLRTIKRLIFTHSHEDHLNAVDLLWRHAGYSVVHHPINVFGNRWVFNRLVQAMIFGVEETGLDTLKINPAVACSGREIRDDDLELLPIAANHTHHEEALNYLLQRNGRSLLIVNDSGYWKESSWDLIRRRHADAVILDSTCGIKYPDARDNHMGCNTVVAFRDRLLELEVIDRDTPVYANHFSHNGIFNHEELCAFYEPHRIQVGYDGLTIEV
ncbi:MBL fold metallo-hydrolase [Victivallis sp. Marseille-Q1083]|uniref:MBL fold metallo-hydrolase n=1 Tax=Victivallis sp. Marseille-Q1083 TaxID=2717288 RepID=UPI00158E698B|nr:MBL fold metallo-hydrolase [Victivallis sp. Marseille-Q1083]